MQDLLPFTMAEDRRPRVLVIDDDPGVRPDKHIFIEKKAPWYTITDSLPQLDENALRAYRSRK